MFLSSEDNMENTEAVTQKGSVKKLFLKTSENSQENTCARVSGAACIFIKKDFGTRFPVSFVKFLRTPFFSIEHLRWLAASASSMLNVLFTVL